MLSKINLISGTKIYDSFIYLFTGMQQDIPIFKQKGFKLFLERCQRYLWISETVRQNVQSIPSNRSTITETSVRTNCFAWNIWSAEYRKDPCSDLFCTSCTPQISRVLWTNTDSRLTHMRMISRYILTSIQLRLHRSYFVYLPVLRMSRTGWPKTVFASILQRRNLSGSGRLVVFNSVPRRLC